MSGKISEGFEAISLTDDWRSALADPLVAQWNFASEAVHDPLSLACLGYGPNIAKFREAGAAQLRMQRIGELADSKDVAAAYLIETYQPDRSTGEAPNPVISGIAVATPGIRLVHRGRAMAKWQEVLAPEPIEGDDEVLPENPVTRVEVCVTGDNKFNKTSQLLAKVVANACELYPEYPQAVMLPHEFPSRGSKPKHDEDFGQLVAGVGSSLPFYIGTGRFGWSDHHPRLVREPQILASVHNPFPGIDQLG